MKAARIIIVDFLYINFWMVEGDLNLSSHSYMRYKESMCRIIALLEVEIYCVNIETIATIY